MLAGHRPQFFRDERHERLHPFENLITRPRHHGLRFGFRSAIRPGEQRLRELQIPVAINVPDEAIGRVRRIVEAIGFDRFGNLGGGPRCFVRDPAIERFLRRLWIDLCNRRTTIHLGEPRSVPELGRKIAVALNTLRGKLDVAALRRHGGKSEAQGIGAIVIDQRQRIDDVAFRLRHLRARRIAHQRVDIDVVKRDHFLQRSAQALILHKMETHHHHASNTEKDDVEAGDQR